MSMNFYVNELLCLWIVMSMNCYAYELLCLWIVMSMNWYVYELLWWIVKSMNCFTKSPLQLRCTIKKNKDENVHRYTVWGEEREKQKGYLVYYHAKVNDL